jgi:hypothetical protein
LIGTCLVLTVSRGAVTATLISAVLFTVWEIFARDWRGIQKRNIIYGLVFVLGVLVLAWSGGVLVDRYTSSVKDFVEQRQAIYDAHWPAFLDSPWFGYGLGTFDEVNKLVQTAINYPVLWDLRATHNVYLQWLEEGGIAGAVPMFACIAWLLFGIALGTRNRRRMTTWLRGLVAASVVILIHGWSDFSLEVPAIAMTWSALLGAGYAISTSQRAVQASSHAPNPESENVGWSQIKRFSPLFLISTFSALVLVLSGLAWWDADMGTGQAGPVLPISAIYAYRAEQLLQSAEANNDATDENISAAQSLTQQELLLSPARADGWVRLAIIASINHGTSAEISQLLDRSFLVAPLDPQIFLQRTYFIFENWDKISSSVRQEVLAQVRVGWNNWIGRDEILRLGKIVHNPSGRFALKFEITQLSSRSGLVGKDN